MEVPFHCEFRDFDVVWTRNSYYNVAATCGACLSTTLGCEGQNGSEGPDSEPLGGVQPIRDGLQPSPGSVVDSSNLDGLSSENTSVLSPT